MTYAIYKSVLALHIIARLSKYQLACLNKDDNKALRMVVQVFVNEVNKVSVLDTGGHEYILLGQLIHCGYPNTREANMDNELYTTQQL